MRWEKSARKRKIRPFVEELQKLEGSEEEVQRLKGLEEVQGLRCFEESVKSLGK
jgi:hypothetical protein